MTDPNRESAVINLESGQTENGNMLTSLNNEIILLRKETTY